jgi:hypothetical protein
MIIHTGQLPNLAQTLLEDLVSRNGSPTTHSLSPYDGMAKIFLQQFKNRDIAKGLEFLRAHKDYDADKQKPIEGEYTHRWVKDGEHLRRLEDIKESWVRKYLENILTAIKINNTNGYREVEKQHQEALTFVDQEGETTEEGELLVEYQLFPPLTIAEAEAKLPYLLKRLHDKSLKLKVSALSLVIAYEKAKAWAKQKPKPQDVLSAGVYRMNSDGTLGHRFYETANTGGDFRAAFAWIRGFDKDTYLDNAMELLKVCEVLGIDITKENPHDFQAADIAKLQVTYITKNRDYLRGSQARNSNVMESLATVSVSDHIPTRQEELSLRQQIENTIQAILDCNDERLRKILEREDEKSIEEVLKRDTDVHNATYDKNIKAPTISDFVTVDGFLHSIPLKGSIAIFQVKEYLASDINFGELAANDGELAAIAIAHISGYLFLVTRGRQIYFQQASLVSAYMQDHIRENYTNKYVGNHTYGWWDSCYA